MYRASLRATANRTIHATFLARAPVGWGLGSGPSPQPGGGGGPCPQGAAGAWGPQTLFKMDSLWTQTYTGLFCFFGHFSPSLHCSVLHAAFKNVRPSDSHRPLYSIRIKVLLPKLVCWNKHLGMATVASLSTRVSLKIGTCLLH